MIEQHQSIADGTARQQVARLVFLKSTDAPADHVAGALLRQAEPLADALDILRLKQALGAGFEPVQRAIGDLLILPS